MIRALLFAIPILTACAPTPIPAPIVVPLGGLDPAGTPTVVGTAGSTPLASLPPIADGIPYECDTGQRVVVSYDGRGATIGLDDGRRVPLDAIESVSGARYAGSGLVWFTDGEGGILTDQGGQAQCRQA